MRRGDSGLDGCLQLPNLLGGKADELAEESEFCDCCNRRPFPLPLPLLGAGSAVPVIFCSRRSALAANSRGSPRKVALGSLYWALPP